MWSQVGLRKDYYQKKKKKKSSGGDRIPAVLFQMLKDDVVKLLKSIFQPIWKTQQWLQDWKRSVFIPITKKCSVKECLSNCTIALISQASKLTLKILQARLQQYVNQELPEAQARFRKGRGIRDQIANISWIIEKAREFQKKKSTSTSWTILKPLTVWITKNCGKFLRDENIRPSYLPPEITVCKSRSNS